MSITVNPIFPVIGAQSVAADVVLQPGTVIDATVQKVLDANLVRIAIANLSIEVLSEVPLKAGQTLQLAVSQTPQGVKLAIVPQGDDGAASNAPLPSANSLAPNPSHATPRAATDIAPNIAALRASQPPDAQLNSSSSVRPLTDIEALAVSAAVQSAAAKQGSLAPLFANINAAASSQTLPPALQEAAARLLSLRPGLNGRISGDDIKAAFEKSGLFLERSLVSRSDAPVATSANPQSPDLKAALIVFRQTVASWLGETPATTLPPDGAKAAQKNATAQADIPSVQGKQNLSPLAPPLAPGIEVDEVLLPGATLLVAEDAADADPRVKIYAPNEALPSPLARSVAAQAGLSSLQEVLQGFPKGVRDAMQTLLAAEANGASASRGSAGRAEGASPSPDIPPPPFRGSAPSAQPVAQATLPFDAEPVAVARHLIDDTDAALARQTLLQVASLPERIDIPGLRAEASAPRWNFEIPFATPQGTAVAQFEISRDGGGISADPQSKTWRARFSLNIEPSGPVHALVTLSGERTSVRMWAERPATAAQLRANAPQLTHALREAALEPGDIVIGDGAPPQPTKPPAGHFLDRAL